MKSLGSRILTVSGQCGVILVLAVSVNFAQNRSPNRVAPEIAAEKKLEIRTLQYSIQKQRTDISNSAAQLQFMRWQIDELLLSSQQKQAALSASEAELRMALKAVEREGWEFDAEALGYKPAPGGPTPSEGLRPAGRSEAEKTKPPPEQQK